MLDIRMSVVAAALCAGSAAQAQDWTYANRFLHPEVPVEAACFGIDSRQGWQRIPVTPAPDGRAMVYLDKEELPADIDPVYGNWTVDRNVYSRVDKMGHRGRDAESLEPYKAYKYEVTQPFGIVLLRVDNGPNLVPEAGSNGYTISARSSMDFRINDADQALGDNAGIIVVCFKAD